jgi:hypothetical protein
MWWMLFEEWRRIGLGEKRSDRGKPEEAGAPASCASWTGGDDGTLKLQAAITFAAESPLWALGSGPRLSIFSAEQTVPPAHLK